MGGVVDISELINSLFENVTPDQLNAAIEYLDSQEKQME